MGSFKRFLAFAGVACLTVGAPARAQQPAANEPAPSDEPTREQCLEAHEQAQAARLNGQLIAARRALRQCTAAACPELVSRDCASWLADVEQQLPSVIFRAVKDGADVVDLRVREGEQLLAESLTGSPLELDPGPHHFVAELSGFPSQRATYVLQAGDKARVVRFEFTTPRPPSPPATATTPVAPLTPPLEVAPTSRPMPTLGYALGGVALVALVTGSVLGGLSLAERDDVASRCEPLCHDRDVARLEGLALAADVSFLVAVLGAGGAGYVYATRPVVPLASRARSSLPATAGSWQVTAGGSF